MKNRLSVRGAAGAAAAGLLLTLSIVHGRAQQASPDERQYPYPAVRDQRGVIPPGPRVAPWASPLADGDAAHLDRQPRDQGGHAGDVVALFALLLDAAPLNVLDGGGRNADALQQGLHEVGR